MRARFALTAAIALVALATVPAAGSAAGPTAIGVDEAGTSYVGWASGAVKRYGVGSGDVLGQWTTAVGNAAGKLGPIMAIDVADAGATAHGGNIWTLDANRRVQEFTRTGSFIRGFRVDACDGSNTPEPGLEGGIDVTPEAIYVAHPCGDRIFRYALGALPASGTSAATPAATQVVYAPHGIAAQTGGGASPPQTRTLYVTQALSSVVRQFDLTTLGLLGDAPGGHSGRYDDVFIDVDGILFVGETNPVVGYDDRIFQYDDTGAEIRGVGGPGAAVGLLSDARAFDVAPQTSAAPGNLFIADTGNERIQRMTQDGFTFWAAGADDPGPPVTPPAPNPPAGSGDGTTLPSGGGGSPGAGGTPGVTIEGGARYTDSPDVSLTVREPAGTTAVEISNLAGFADSDTRALRESLDYDWTLDASGSDANPRAVYVRFPGSGSDRVYSDEIILDRRAPLVGRATLTRKGRRRGHGTRSWILRVTAEDPVSGIDQLQAAGGADRPFRSQDFKARSKVERPKRFRFVRVTDFAGNVSAPLAVRGGP